MPNARTNFSEVIAEAIRDIAEHGYDSAERVAYWSEKIRAAAEATLKAPGELDKLLRGALAATYRRLIDRGEIARFHQGVGRFTIEKLRPALRSELDRRILASAGLIRLNRKEAVEQTIRRFAGWSTSIPKGGSAEPEKAKARKNLKKALASLPFEERRVLIDQGHKLTSSINEIIATDGGAIAAEWRSHWRQSGYNYREDHKERDEQVYLVRGSWAQANGLVKLGPAGYTDDVTKPAEEPFCRCFYRYIYHLRGMPQEMITRKGVEELERVRAA